MEIHFHLSILLRQHEKIWSNVVCMEFFFLILRRYYSKWGLSCNFLEDFGLPIQALTLRPDINRWNEL